jgi:ABC-type polysaccharide/polyol phosphate export permease
VIFFSDFVDATRKWRVWSSLAKFDIKKRYKRSFLGPWWITLAMFFLISAIGILYSQLFKLDFAKYLLYLSINFAIWTFMRDSILESCQVLIDAKALLFNEKWNFLIFSFRVVYKNFIIFLHNIIIFIFLAIAFLDQLNIFNVLISVITVVFLILFLLPVCILCSMINTRFRDFFMIMSNVMQLLFFLSPILFNKQLLESYYWLLYINPLALFILLINEPILINQFHLNYLTYLLGYFAFFTCLVAFLFAKYKNKITYWL